MRQVNFWIIPVEPFKDGFLVKDYVYVSFSSNEKTGNLKTGKLLLNYRKCIHSISCFNNAYLSTSFQVMKKLMYGKLMVHSL